MDARQLHRPAVHLLPRITDRGDYLVISRGRVEKTRDGVELWTEQEGEPIRAFIPVGSLALLGLGPGASITSPAVKAINAVGTTIIFTDGEGLNAYAAARPLTESSAKASAQAALHTNPTLRLRAARYMYAVRFGVEAETLENSTLAELRGAEGRRVRDTYQKLARERGTKFRRDTRGSDEINRALNYGNSVLYGMAGAVCSALGLNPALGIIHEGNVRAFLFDIADMHKERISFCAAFADPGDGLSARARVRGLIRKEKTIAAMFQQVEKLLEIAGQHEANEALFDPEGNVPAHTKWGLA